MSCTIDLWRAPPDIFGCGTQKAAPEGGLRPGSAVGRRGSAVVRRVVCAVTVTRVRSAAVSVTAVPGATVRASGAASLGIVSAVGLGDAADGVISALALAHITGGVIGALALAHLGGRIVSPLLGTCDGGEAAERGDGEDCEEECGEA